MDKTIKNYMKFVLSLMIMGFGISLVTKSNLGTSAISSVPYVLSRVFNLSFGMFTFIVNMIYFTIQIIILKKDFPNEQYLQIIVGPILGLFIDLSMGLLNQLSPNAYIIQLLVLCLGCIVIAFSIWLQLEANVITNPNEGLVKTIAEKTKQPFSTIKTGLDIFLVILASSISLIGLKTLVGVREGTLISAFLVGYIIKVIYKIQERREQYA